jgi:heme exporter protein B
MFAKTLLALIQQEILVCYRQTSDTLMPFIYFLMILVLFPLVFGPEQKILQMLAPAFIWVAILLAILIAVTRLFRDEHREGSLEQLLLCEILALHLLIKIGVHWLLTVLPILIFLPMAALLFQLPFKIILLMELTLLLGTPTLMLIGAIGSALTLGLRNQGILIVIVILPLFLPVLIFSMGCIDACNAGLAYTGQIAILAAMVILAILFAPLAIATALRLTN